MYNSGSQIITFGYRLLIRAVICDCLSVRPSLRYVRVLYQKRVTNHILKMFSPTGSHTHTILFFHSKRYGNIPTAATGSGPPTAGRTSNEGRIKHRYFHATNLASSRVVNGATIRCCKHSVAGQWQVCDTYRLSLCTALE